MTGLNLLESVQMVTVKGEQLAILRASEWEKLVEWLENIEDSLLIQGYTIELQNAQENQLGNQSSRALTGWLKWDEVEGELDNEQLSSLY